MNILVTGSSGLIGSTVVEFFANRGHSVFCLQRNKEPEAASFWNFDRLNATLGKSGIDAVIHLAGENIATGRWTRKKKNKILDSRVLGTSELVQYCCDLKKKPKVFLSASAIGYYGNRGETIMDESSPAGVNFVAEVCREWERVSSPVKSKGIRLVNTRIGMVLSGKGGTLSTMLPSFKMGIAGIVGNGCQWVSWIDIRDIIEIFSFIIDNTSIEGPVNLVSPNPVTNKIFTKTLGKVLNRPTVMRMPAFVARTVFGQMGTELVLSSTRVKPGILLSNGYQFLAPDLEESLDYCIFGSKK